MKKILCALLVSIHILSMFSISASAAYEAPTKFSSVYDYGDSVYTVNSVGFEHSMSYNKIENLHSLPKIYAMNEDDSIYNFCIYHDKLYLLIGCNGMEPEPARIYSCNMDGSGLTLLANNASTYSEVYIVDGVLYYSAYTSDPDWGYNSGYYGGIYSINLYDLSWKKISSDPYANIYYCDGDYIYYCCDSDNYYAYYDDSPKPDTYAIKTNGTKKMKVKSNCDEFASLWGHSKDGYLKGNQYYYLSNNQLYVRNKNGGNSRWLGSLPSSFNSKITSVTDNYVYCTTMNVETTMDTYYYVSDLHKFSR